MGPCAPRWHPPAATRVDSSGAISESTRGCLPLREGPKGAHSVTLAASTPTPRPANRRSPHWTKGRLPGLTVAIGPLSRRKDAPGDRATYARSEVLEEVHGRGALTHQGNALTADI
jgi:hypothetical protein